MGIIHQHGQFEPLRREIGSNCRAINLQARVHQEEGYPLILVLRLQFSESYKGGIVSRANRLRHNYYCLVVVVPSHVMLCTLVIDQSEITNALTGSGAN
jgi:hypothetical protein